MTESSDSQNNADRELLVEFLDESLDALANLDNLVLQMEANPDDLGVINTIFRPAHTIKGNSAFFGLMRVKKLAHELETLLDLLRKGKLRIQRTLIEVVLLGIDELKAMLERVRVSKPEVIDESAFEKILKTVADASVATDSAQILWTELVTKLDSISIRLPPDDKKLMTDLETVISALKRQYSIAPPKQRESVPLPAPVEKIKSLLSKPSEQGLSREEGEAVAGALQDLKTIVEGEEAVKLAEEALRTARAFLSTVGFDRLCCELVGKNFDAVVALKRWKTSPPVQPPQAAVRPLSGADAVEPPKTMRVSEQHIDSFLAYVGELIVVGEMFNHLQNKIAAKLTDDDMIVEFKRVNETFSQLFHNLQRSIMTIRKIPMRGLLQKAPRLARDIATKSGKDIKVTLEGESVEVDKSLVDLLDGPLTHIIRNAADHGIETPDVRKAADKPPQGSITVSVRETDNSIILTCEDDGAGLRYDAIRAKGEALGLIKKGVALTEDNIVSLLFLPGVSTAKEITDISGRGVGMDVVKKAIESAGGQIQVVSTPGKGTRFVLTVTKSVTTQIMYGFLIKAGRDCYVLPMDKVIEAVCVVASDVVTVLGKGECITRHGEVLPVRNVKRLLGLSDMAPAWNDRYMIITVRANKKKVALMVDDVLGVQQVVLKEMKGATSDGDIFDGGAIMGDGSVALVVNIDKICATEADAEMEKADVSPASPDHAR
jgi:two-component system chemotaxis sensor kinase CheA